VLEDLIREYPHSSELLVRRAMLQQLDRSDHSLEDIERDLRAALLLATGHPKPGPWSSGASCMPCETAPRRCCLLPGSAQPGRPGAQGGPARRGRVPPGAASVERGRKKSSLRPSGSSPVISKARSCAQSATNRNRFAFLACLRLRPQEGTIAVGISRAQVIYSGSETPRFLERCD